MGQAHGSSPRRSGALSFCSAGDLSPRRGRVPELCPQVSRGGCVWPCLLSSFSSPPAGRAHARATPLPPYTSSSSGCAALCRLPAGTWHGDVPPPAALCHQRCHPCCWPRCTSRPRAVPGSPVPLPETFPPVSVTSASERPRIADSGERSSCPLLYLLHLPNLMTGGMRSISNMASFAGSGQSTQEAFLHTPIPACSAAPVPSSPGHPAAACPCCGARRGARRGWWPWGPSRAPGSGWGGHWTPACFTGRIWGVPEAVGRGTPAPGSPRASFAAWACGERVPTMGTRTSLLPTALARAQVPCSAPARWKGREGHCGLSRAQTREVSGGGGL